MIVGTVNNQNVKKKPNKAESK
jgi:hypothetical protein